MKTITNLKDKLKKLLKITLHYSFIIIGLVVSFSIGFYFDEIQDLNSKKIPDVIKRRDVNIAIDESSNLLLIDKKSGNYTILQDSLGRSIFTIYARSIFQNSTSSTNANP